MPPAPIHPRATRNVSHLIRQRIQSGGERLWRFNDFSDLPAAAVAQTLSRLSRAGMIQRLSKGTYFRTRSTPFGPSKPNPAAILRLASPQRTIFPSGIAAANLLGFTTQNPARSELATTARSLPRKLIGSQTILHTARPAAWSRLSTADACLLDFLRNRGSTNELPPAKALALLTSLLAEPGRFPRLARAARTEPPRVRAMLGALGDRIGAPRRTLDRLRKSLNPLSRFDFGILATLPNARDWHAKDLS